MELFALGTLLILATQTILERIELLALHQRWTGTTKMLQCL